MSNLTIASLKAMFGFEQTHSVHHNRSDNFIRYFIEQTDEMIPEEYFDNLLSYKPESEAQARQFLQNQYRKYVGFHGLLDKKDPNTDFLIDLATYQFDVILLDNFMDIAARLMVHKARREFMRSPLFLNAGFYSNQAEILSLFDWFGDYLTPQESAENWLKIYKWLREFQPNAKMFFLSYHYCTSTSSPDRYRRAREFYPAFKAMTEGEDIHVVPPLCPPLELTKGEVNWPHFEPPIYRALAGYVYLHTVGGMEFHQKQAALHC